MRPPSSIVEVPVQKVAGTALTDSADVLAVEEPLEIQVAFGPTGERTVESISITMRTPGNDRELAAGFLLTEGIIYRSEDIYALGHFGPALAQQSPDEAQNVVRVELRPGVKIDLERLQRHFYTTSSCGVCGKTSIDAIRAAGAERLPEPAPLVNAEVIHGLPATLRAAQAVFERTGGLHAAALFDPAGTLEVVREDVGRHNAVDKLIGSQLLAKRLPLHDRLLLVSGRASFELVQKALMAGIPLLAAVGAPSSLAVELAQQFNLTLLGFVRDERFNIYAGAARVGVTGDIATT